ncbi:hypothetical protein IQ277_34420 [Nostocales cyanobacterium LEGE 12452]|nr:hypothetical protein [Nostocales cyanobacterium LEGE 12452]
MVQVQSWVKTNLALVTLSDSEDNEHTIVFLKGKAIEIICFHKRKLYNNKLTVTVLSFDGTVNYSELHHRQPIAHHRPTLAPKVNPNLPLPQICIPVRLTISNSNSPAFLGRLTVGRTCQRYRVQGAASGVTLSIQGQEDLALG